MAEHTLMWAVRTCLWGTVLLVPFECPLAPPAPCTPVVGQQSLCPSTAAHQHVGQGHELADGQTPSCTVRLTRVSLERGNLPAREQGGTISTLANQKNQHTLCFCLYTTLKKWGEPGVPLPATSFSTNIQYIFMYSSSPWANVFLFFLKQHSYYAECCLKTHRCLNKRGGSLRLER